MRSGWTKIGGIRRTPVAAPLLASIPPLMTPPDAASSPEPGGDGSRFAETFALPQGSLRDDLSKEEQDVALAAALLETGALSERQLGAALSQWSIHGDVPLAEHLEKSGVVKGPQIEKLRLHASRRSQESRQNAPQDSASAAPSLSGALNRMDASGRVARLLGLSAAAGSNATADRTTESRYVLVRKLGQGGLGRVWLAYDSSLRRHVALKELTEGDSATEATLRRFQNEAEITGKLEHPGIVPLYQLGHDAGTGGVFYTMRFLGKSTLQNAIAEYHERREEGDDNPMILRELLTAFVSICQAVAHAHSRRVIHRDLKPENVVIDSFGQVIVIDWGLAKLLDETAPDLHAQADGPVDPSRSGTMEGQVLGTPLYMAPEQAAGRLDEIDQRTDVYGLGAILFSIITGMAPHEATQVRLAEARAGVRALLGEIAGGPTPSAHQLSPSADPALSAICAKAMARRRYARYQEAAELAEDVQRWMAGESVRCFDEPPVSKLRRWAGRNPRLSQAIGAVVLSMLIGGLTWASSTRNTQMAEQARRYEELRGDFREVEIRLRESVHDLSRNARFMTSIPPIQGIIGARFGDGGEDEAVWIGRLESIFSGLLRANGNYLSVSFIAAETPQEQGGDAEASPPEAAGAEVVANEIVRIDRSRTDRWYVRTVPRGKLVRGESMPLLAAASKLEPGDVTLGFDSVARGGSRTLTLSVPVFDEARGVWFGAVAIELDLSGQLDTILSSVVLAEGEMLLVGGNRQVWVVADSAGVRPTVNALGVPTDESENVLPEAVRSFFDGLGPRVANDGHSYYGERFPLGPDGPELVVVAKTQAAR